MRNICVKKGLVVGIIVLFLLIGIYPSTATNTVKKTSNPINNGNTLYVGGSGPNNYSKIQAAIDFASNGDTIFVYDDSAPYYENLWIEKSIYLIGENKYTTQINGSGIDTKSVVAILADNVTVKGFNIENSGASPVVTDSGIIAIDSHNHIFEDNLITFNKYGICLWSSRGSTVTNNIIIRNTKQGGYGIISFESKNTNISHNLISISRYLIGLAGTKNDIIYKNKIIDSTTHSGIWAQFCDYITINQNNISNNRNRGIDLYDCDNCNISWNYIFNNGENDTTQGDDGICIRVSSHYNVVWRNFIGKHWDYGLLIPYECNYTLVVYNDFVDNNIGVGVGSKYWKSCGNKFYHNNFINNTKNAKAGKISQNFWDDSYPSGGNYWDDYTGEDNDGDGIGDIPYNISGKNDQDLYPLINKWGENPPYAYFIYRGEDLTFTFDASISVDRDGTITMYEWDFGDSTTGTGEIIEHTYTSEDDYTVTLTITDDDGKKHSTTRKVFKDNSPPKTPPKPSGVNLVIPFVSESYSTSTTDPDGGMVQYRFDWDADGIHDYSSFSSLFPSGTWYTTSHWWESVGTYVIKVQACDEHGFASDWSPGLTVVVNNPPREPLNPQPNDGATDVDVDADISWRCSDPDGDELSYDVYFGDSSPPPKVASDLPEKTYNPGTMNFSTKYYWQIVAKDEHLAKTEGPIWRFTTSSEPNDPPYIPSSPIPEDGATDVDVETILSWTGGDPNENDTVFYDVYLEADDYTPDVKVAEDIDETMFDPGRLKYGTIYYWQVVSRDNHYAITEGPVWSFTTEENTPPDAPHIDGPTNGRPDKPYNYSFVTIDPDGDDVYYFVDWGDSSVTWWIGPYDSGEEITISNIWREQGTYTIRAKAKDLDGAESGWGELVVTIPRYKILSNSLLLWFLEQFPILKQLLFSL